MVPPMAPSTVLLLSRVGDALTSWVVGGDSTVSSTPTRALGVIMLSAIPDHSTLPLCQLLPESSVLDTFPFISQAA